MANDQGMESCRTDLNCSVESFCNERSGRCDGKLLAGSRCKRNGECFSNSCTLGKCGKSAFLEKCLFNHHCEGDLICNEAKICIYPDYTKAKRLTECKTNNECDTGFCNYNLCLLPIANGPCRVSNDLCPTGFNCRSNICKKRLNDKKTPIKRIPANKNKAPIRINKLREVSEENKHNGNLILGGIVISVILVVSIISFIVVYCIKRRKKANITNLPTYPYSPGHPYGANTPVGLVDNSYEVNEPQQQPPPAYTDQPHSHASTFPEKKE